MSESMTITKQMVREAEEAALGAKHLADEAHSAVNVAAGVFRAKVRDNKKGWCPHSEVVDAALDLATLETALDNALSDFYMKRDVHTTFAREYANRPRGVASSGTPFSHSKNGAKRGVGRYS